MVTVKVTVTVMSGISVECPQEFPQDILRKRQTAVKNRAKSRKYPKNAHRVGLLASTMCVHGMSVDYPPYCPRIVCR